MDNNLPVTTVIMGYRESVHHASLLSHAGEAPVDPSVGFLPPNNGTDGQGFVTFSVRAREQMSSLFRIDATASIIFDQNEPIDTPPIFNTVNNTVAIDSIDCSIGCVYDFCIGHIVHWEVQLMLKATALQQQLRRHCHHYLCALLMYKQ